MIKLPFSDWDLEQYEQRKKLSDWKIFDDYKNKYIVDYIPNASKIIGQKK